MKPKDIEVGQKYLNTRQPKCVYLGVGRERDCDHYTSKCLVVIKNGKTNPFCVGNIVVPYRENPEFWKAFVPFN